jgi:hypothetical protein
MESCFLVKDILTQLIVLPYDLRSTFPVHMQALLKKGLRKNEVSRHDKDKNTEYGFTNAP